MKPLTSPVSSAETGDLLFKTFLLPRCDPTVVILTGPKGCGKSSVCMAFARAARRMGLDVAGVVTARLFGETTALPGDAVRSPRREQPPLGLVVVDVCSGQRVPLAYRRADPADPKRTWVMDEAGLRFGEDVLSRVGPCDVLVVDEIGRLELLHGRGWREAIALLRRGAFRVAAVGVRDGLASRLAQELRCESLPSMDIQVVRIGEPAPAHRLAAFRQLLEFCWAKRTIRGEGGR